MAGKSLLQSLPDHPDPVELKVTGSFPEWLNGDFLFSAGTLFELSGGFTMNHYFDGYAHMYRFNFNKGKITYQSRYLNTDAYTKATSIGKPMYTEFGTRNFPDPKKGLFSRMVSSVVPGDLTDNVASSVYEMHGFPYCGTESCFIHQLDVPSLTSKAKVDINKAVGINFFCTHPLKDKDGTIYNMGTTFIGILKYHLVKIPPVPKGQESKYAADPLKDAKVIASFSPSWKTNFSYFHSFAMTENYIIFIELPLLISSLKLATLTVKGKALKDCLEWTPSEKTKFILIEKKTGTVLKTKYRAEAFFFFHIINAFEENDHVVIDLDAYSNADVLDDNLLSNLRNSDLDFKPDSQMRRYVIPLVNPKEVESGKNLIQLSGTSAQAQKEKDDVIMCTPEVDEQRGWELPTINCCHIGQKYRYFYGMGGFHGGFFRRSCFKMDLQTKELKQWKGEDDKQFASEVLFVKSPSAKDEDDGVAIVHVSDAKPDRKCFLLLLDAKTFKEIARAEIPVFVPLGFHGLFLPTK